MRHFKTILYHVQPNHNVTVNNRLRRQLSVINYISLRGKIEKIQFNYFPNKYVVFCFLLKKLKRN